MSTALTAYSGVRDPLVFIKEMGATIAKSQMFGCESESQGQVFAMACLSQKCDPLTLPQTYHLMHGRLVMRADAMLGRLSAAGGEYTVVSHTPDVAEIIVEFKGRKYRERLTWDDAKQEPFVYSGKPADIMPALLAGDYSKLKLSTNYATPRRRSQHLWARVVSDAVRVIAPELVTGAYSPEEMVEVLGKPVPAHVETSPPINQAVVEAVAEREAIQLESTSTIAGDVVDASFTIVGGEVVTAGVDLQLKAAEPVKQSQPAKPVEDIPKVFQRNMADRIDRDEEAALKKLVIETNMIVPGIADQVKNLFVSQGLKFADLSWKAAEDLRRKLEVKELEAMAGLMLSRGT